MTGREVAPMGDEDFPEEDFTPPQPEILSIVLEERLLGRSFFPGTIRDLPCLYRLELVACLQAEQEFKTIQLINSAIKNGHQDG